MTPRRTRFTQLLRQPAIAANDDMDNDDPNPILLEAELRPRCVPCALARSSWAAGGHHLTCRACEIGGVADGSLDARQAFYSRLVAEVSAAAAGGVRGVALRGRAA